MAFLHQLQQMADQRLCERDTKPTTGELDNECMAKDNNGTCTKKQ